ncbi:hypothetical protein PoB_005973400 [Plakobranchus ocellatus]|uniref:Uncharacterized protein n=1 Tax=Plakobranchus ocellatus TaxID=259542 RepID=A0AAV4CK51_9GAST|nr:hypothetical protein PoB_005973400 [Plakobranchus ocellatus]
MRKGKLFGMTAQAPVRIFYIASPQQGDLRLSGRPSSQGTDGEVRTRERRFPADFRVDSLATVPSTPPAQAPVTEKLRQPSVSVLLSAGPLTASVLTISRHAACYQCQYAWSQRETDWLQFCLSTISLSSSSPSSSLSPPCQ